MKKTSRGTACVRIEIIRRTAKRGDDYLSQSPEQFAVAFRALGGNEGRNRLAKGKLAPKQSVQ
jgi:hypothetical protein